MKWTNKKHNCNTETTRLNHKLLNQIFGSNAANAKISITNQRDIQRNRVKSERWWVSWLSRGLRNTSQCWSSCFLWQPAIFHHLFPRYPSVVNTEVMWHQRYNKLRGIWSGRLEEALEPGSGLTMVHLPFHLDASSQRCLTVTGINAILTQDLTEQ